MQEALLREHVAAESRLMLLAEKKIEQFSTIMDTKLKDALSELQKAHDGESWFEVEVRD
jgi:hypothetical protein